MGTQISIFDGANKFVNDKPIRLIECFAGYGSQALALKYLGVKFEHHKIAEWAVKSIQAYKDMHFPNDTTDYSADMSYESIVDFLFEKGISADYNAPMTKAQILRMGESKCRTVYNNIKATHNLVSVCNVKAKDLQITDTDRFTYLLTYSFPCQDLSNAGAKKGMDKGSGTRSGLLWEIERILKECEELPQILIMENVPQVVGKENKDSFSEWLCFLDTLGYHSSWEIINGTDFLMPQNRKRCFMISILGDYYYDFPRTLGCKLRLKDVLQQYVDEKYYLSNDILKYFIKHTKESKEKGNGFRFEPTDGDCTAKCVTTRAGGRMDDNFIEDRVHSVVKLPHGYFPGSIERNAEASPTIDTGVGNWHTLIGEETVSKCEQLGYIEKDGFNEMTGRVYGTNGASPTVRTFCGGGQEVKIAEPLALDEQNGYIRKDGTVGTIMTDGSSPKHNNRVVVWDGFNQRIRSDQDAIGTLTRNCGADLKRNGQGIIELSPELVGGFGDKKSNVGTQWYQQNRVYSDESVAMAHCERVPCGSYNYLDNASVRKLTERECFRLMGVRGVDFERVAKNQSMSSLYHLAGDSIITNCLMAILGELFDVDWQRKVEELMEDLKDGTEENVG